MTPANVGSLTISVNTADISLVTPKVSVYNGAGRLVSSVSTTNPQAGGVTLTISQASLLSTYYVKVEGARNDVFDIGAYQLNVKFVPVVNSLVGLVTGTVNTVTTTV